MSGIVKDNGFLAELDLKLMNDLVQFCEEKEQKDSIANIVILESLPWEDDSKKAA